MGRNKKDFFHSQRGARGGQGRVVVSDRKSSAARPWNHPDVVNASTSYGVTLNSPKQVHSHENALEDMGSLTSNERMTCRDCGKFNSEHEEHVNGN